MDGVIAGMDGRDAPAGLLVGCDTGGARIEAIRRPGGTVLAFVLTAPLLNPISFLYGLTLGEPRVILTFASITLAKTAVVAWMWDAWFGGSADKARAVSARIADAMRTPSAGPKRILAVLVTAARELSGRDAFYYLIGLLGNAVLSSFIPFAALQKTMAHHDKMAPLRMPALIDSRLHVSALGDGEDRVDV